MIIESPHFITATILEWKRLLKPDKYAPVGKKCSGYLPDYDPENIKASYAYVVRIAGYGK
jgi:hypothetical protein